MLLLLLLFVHVFVPVYSVNPLLGQVKTLRGIMCVDSYGMAYNQNVPLAVPCPGPV